MRCTPVVCMGGPLSVARPPNRSVRPPKAVRLESAFKAPGFDNNCANGIAVANELTVVELANGLGGFVNGIVVVNGLVGLLEVEFRDILLLLVLLLLLPLLLLLLLLVIDMAVDVCVLLFELFVEFVFKLFKLLLLLL